MSLTLNALWRHVLAFQGGEDVDPESGCSHMAHAAWHCLNAIMTVKDHPEFDDRYVPPSDLDVVHRLHAAFPHVQFPTSRKVPMGFVTSKGELYTQQDRERDTVSAPTIYGREAAERA